MTVLVRLTEEVDAWGETFPAGTEMMVVGQPDEGAYEVAFPTSALGRMCVGTITQRVCEEVGSEDRGSEEPTG